MRIRKDLVLEGFMAQRQRQLYKERQGNMALVPNYGELTTRWAMHQAFGTYYSIRFSHGNPILQILKTEASRGYVTCQGHLFCKYKSWKSNLSILHLLKLLTLFPAELESWAFAVWYPSNGHSTKENPIKVSAQCCGAAQEKGFTLSEGNG